MSDQRKIFINTFSYIKQLVLMGQNPVYSVLEYRNAVILESELYAKPGVNHSPESEDGSPVWLEIERLQKRKAPQPIEELGPWIKQSHIPTQKPILKEWLIVTVPGEESDEMIENGIAFKHNVLESPIKQGLFDVRLFSKDNTKLESLFNDYLRNEWMPWAIEEKPRRETIAIYEKLFAINQMMEVGEIEQPIELVWGIGHAIWKVPDTGKVINHPLLETLIEIELDKNTQALRIRPRSVSHGKPRIFIDPFEALQISGVKPLKEFFEKHLEQLDVEEKTIQPADPTSFESVLRSAASLLSQDACYVPDIINDVTNRAIPRIEESLAITDTWAIYARARGSNYLVRDLELFQEKAKSDEKFNASVIVKFATEPSSEKAKSGNWNLYGRTSVPSPGSIVGEISEDQEGDGTVYFPKPFNDAQCEIIKRLEKTDGVVVQGPPGTGKTHTIANIICHYLATGRRVLVTAKSETALEVLKSQIPKEIQPLIISMVSSDRAGMDQQKTAIEALQFKVVSLQGKERQIFGEIKAGEEKVFCLQQEIRDIEKQIEDFARKQIEPLRLEFADRHFKNASDLAMWVVKYRSNFNWFPDKLGPEEKYTPLFGDEDIEKFIAAKQVVGKEIGYLDFKVPLANNLPDTETIERIHRDLFTARKMKSKAIEDGVSSFLDESVESIRTAGELVQEVKELQCWLTNIDLSWLKIFFDNCVYPDHPVPSWLEIVNEMRSELAVLAETHKRYLRKPVFYVVNGTKERDILKKAVNRGIEGKSPLSYLQWLDRRSKEIVKSVLIFSKSPASVEDWKHIGDYLSFEDKCTEFAFRWNTVAVDGPIPKIELNTTKKQLEEIWEHLKKSEHIANVLTKSIWCKLIKVFPNTSGFHQIEPKKESLECLIESIEQNISIYRLSTSEKYVLSTVEQLERFDCPESIRLKEFLNIKVGSEDISIEAIKEEWRSLMARLRYLHGLLNSFETICKVTDKIKRSGAILWAKHLSENPFTEEEKNILLKWQEAWRWTRLNTMLCSIDIQQRLILMEDARQEKESLVKKAFEEIVKKRTFLTLCSSMTDRAKTGLAKFMAAIMKVGSGKGIKAPIFMKAAQKAMSQCAEAIPCWIMPSWRVSEVLPAEFDFFDLVIVDEASQCDVRELPAIARGKKLLIVGDDRQVSPTAPFIEFNKFLQLKHNYLSDQPFGDLMLPGYSLYDLAGAVFPGNKIILNEHFRCVEPIIRFSFQFYDGVTIHPLRIPKANERIDPPLVDIFVEDGFKKGDLNVNEAKVIVDEIEKLVNDSQYEKRSIGVISLIGRKQAVLIQTKLLERIGQEQYIKHQIICGDSATFQGREKDIMFLSMVASPGQSKAVTTRPSQQRFNVAASRARDRLYVVRSIKLDELKNPEDLKAKLLRHLQDPMPNRYDIDQDLLERCDSDFEREVFAKLTTMGYLAMPQVPAGDYRIDLVVEGDNDHRLAIELDGDKYHGPERWLEDWTRQKVLERVGWKFWRCWASSYTNNQEECINGLVQRLESMGIHPLGGKAKSFAYTDFRSVNTLLQTDESETLDDFDENENISIGDKVVLGLEDRKEYLNVFITENRSEPENLIFNKNHPVAVALIGKTLEDEIEINILGKHQKVCIVQLAKGKRQEDVARGGLFE